MLVLRLCAFPAKTNAPRRVSASSMASTTSAVLRKRILMISTSSEVSISLSFIFVTSDSFSFLLPFLFFLSFWHSSHSRFNFLDEKYHFIIGGYLPYSICISFFIVMNRLSRDESFMYLMCTFKKSNVSNVRCFSLFIRIFLLFYLSRLLLISLKPFFSFSTFFSLSFSHFCQNSNSLGSRRLQRWRREGRLQAFRSPQHPPPPRSSPSPSHQEKRQLLIGRSHGASSIRR